MPYSSAYCMYRSCSQLAILATFQLAAKRVRRLCCSSATTNDRKLTSERAERAWLSARIEAAAASVAALSASSYSCLCSARRPLGEAELPCLACRCGDRDLCCCG
eukprot:651-Heterococcus_DN1.PRE.2